jgi:peroxiredoxin
LIERGTPAPDFTLRDQEGKKVSLADFRGEKVLLCFYPLDFSPVCTDQLSTYQDVLGEIEAKGARLVGISVDSPYCHRAFREKLDLSFPLLADFEPKGDVSKAYGAWIEQTGHGNRSLVLVDEEGTVEWSHASPSPLEIPAAELIFDALVPSR